jgi:dTDP-4-dehydrorhamnose 3,5-epimerase
VTTRPNTSEHERDRRSAIPGCVEIRPEMFVDDRGTFVKPLTADDLRRHGASIEVGEVFWSRSSRGTLRGLHFQLPPHQVAKVVWCTSGSVFDVIVDLRVDSPVHGICETLRLDASIGNSVIIPAGCAHGFLVTDEEATVCYLQSGPFDSSADHGILWSSVGVTWPPVDGPPRVSSRDAAFPPLSDFDSPFSMPDAG